MHIASPALILLSAVVPAALAPATSAQGRNGYMNVESPQVDPIAVADLENSAGVSRPFLFVCNTPNDRVEVFDLGAGVHPPPQVADIPVGQDPVSVLIERFDVRILGTPIVQTVNGIFTANFLGDSVTYADYDFVVDGEGNLLSFTPIVRGEVDVGDSPTDLALSTYSGDEPRLFVAKRSESSYAVLDVDPVDLRVVVKDVHLIVDADEDGPGFSGPVPSATGLGDRGLKEPHAILVHPTRPELWVLGQQGGSGQTMYMYDDNNPSQELRVLAPFDLDICVVDISDPDNPTPSVKGIEGLGTTNFNMSFRADGDALYVVGTRARIEVEGNAALSAMTTGFAQTMLYRVDTRTPFVDMDELSSDGVEAWDVNTNTRNENPVSENDHVQPPSSLAHLTDIDVGPGPLEGFDHLWTTAFNSDNFAAMVIRSDLDLTGQRPIVLRTRLFDGDVPPRDQLRGSRALALEPVSGDTYILNRLDNSVSLLEPLVPPIGAAYTFDPADIFDLGPTQEPGHIVAGRRFLYSTRFSGSGFVSCATCHIDGRSDQLSWRLTGEVGIPIFAEPEASNEPIAFPGSFTQEKGRLVTQSLQGLTNFEANRVRMPGTDAFQIGDDDPEFDLLSNAPFHWRGDKRTFLHFNEAFVGLQGMEVGTPTTTPGAYQAADAESGLTEDEMEAYEAFVFSIHYPPNRLQSIDRSYDGSLGGASNFNDGDGALRGLKLFHIVPFGSSDEPDLLGGRSCVQCHFLPEGSNNRLTENFVGRMLCPPDEPNCPNATASSLLFQPLETPGLRGMRQKEGLLELSAQIDDGTDQLLQRVRTGDFGLTHEGAGLDRPKLEADQLSLNHFKESTTDSLPDTVTDPDGLMTDLNDFTRQLDHGVAPLVGRSFSVKWRAAQSAHVILDDGDTLAPNTAAGAQAAIDEWVQEARDGNADIVVTLHDYVGGMAQPPQMLVYDVVEGMFVGAETVPPDGLLGSVSNLFDTLIVSAVPLGSGYRVAGLTPPNYQTGGGPLLNYPAPIQIGTAPNEAYAPVPGVLSFNFTPPTGVPLPGGELPLSIRTLQKLLFELQAIPAGAARIPLEITHDVPRRLQFVAAGGEFLPGTVIELFLHHSFPPASGLPAQSSRLDLPIFATDEEDEAGRAIWETAIELDSLVLYTLLAGGPHAPGIDDAWFDPAAADLTDAITNWNFYAMRARYTDSDGTHRSLPVNQELRY